MFKDILVAVGEHRAAAEYALSFARRFEAEVTAVCVNRNSILDAMASAEARYDFIVDGGEAEEEALRNLRRFAAQANQAGVTAHLKAPEDFDSEERRDMPGFARCFDLVLLEQPDPGQSRRGHGALGALASGCGRPLLAIPYIQRSPASLTRVAVAWDGSASAARALGDALPILRAAGAVEVVTVIDARAHEDLPRGVRVTRHLARHGIDATFRAIPSEIDAGDMLLSHVADSGADLLVAGGYGHSRLSEALLGGVTRTLLESMTVPVFMSH